MDPREVGEVHPAMPQGIIGRGSQISEEAQLAIDRPQTRDQCRAQMRLGDVMRIKEEVVPVT